MKMAILKCNKHNTFIPWTMATLSKFAQKADSSVAE